MQFDWFTVGAQLVNFLVVVYVLKRLLYRPVLDAMARRERRITDRLQQAESRERDAEASSRAFARQSADLEREKATLLEQARADADAERRSQVARARADVSGQRATWQRQLEQEWADARERFRALLAEGVAEATRRALTDLADTDLETAMVRTFVRRLADVSAEDRETVRAIDEDAEIATAFDLTPDLEREMTDAIRQTFGPRDVRFTRDAGLVGGVDVRVGGWLLSWTLADYVRGLERRLAEALVSNHAAATAGQ